jgi:hypothetical protein
VRELKTQLDAKRALTEARPSLAKIAFHGELLMRSARAGSLPGLHDWTSLNDHCQVDPAFWSAPKIPGPYLGLGFY